MISFWLSRFTAGGAIRSSEPLRRRALFREEYGSEAPPQFCGV
jgi:hypothetical protein